VKNPADLDHLRIPDPHKDGRLPLFLEAASRVLDVVGDRVPLSLTTAGPFTTAASIRGTDQFLRDLRRDPQLVHRLLRFSLDSILPFAREAIRRGARIGLAEPVASGTLISAAQFRLFAKPYLTELIAELTRMAGAPPSLHICGNSAKIWHDMADTGASVLSLDDEVDLGEARRTVGDRVALLGNICPTATMVMGTPETVRENVRRCLKGGIGTPKGYILGLGCALPINTPAKNIHALMDAAREYGRWPVDPERL
jgi:uroporphyrinogen decarboxylase